MIRVVVADDHPVVLAGIKSLIEADGEMRLVGEATDGIAALDLILAERPDVAVLDLSMPGINGIRLAEETGTRCPEVKILILTVHEDRAYVERLLRGGASGYLLKRSAAGDLVRAIRAVAGGATYIDPVVAGSMLKERARDGVPQPAEDLSPREEAVLKMVAQGFSNKEMAASLDLSIKSVETYRARGAGKLGLRTRADIVRHGISRGWLDGP